jgi:glucosyl-3-phosphoglycerate synthase
VISVVIPALNEAETIASVVRLACGARGVREVIVVDDGSIDGTPELARAAGATVIRSTMLGKGASLEDGLRAAQCGVIVYLDADLVGLREDLIERLTAPILEGATDFVKARFSRAGGRVTALTARPLLMTFFPELASIDQPLGGIVAARRSLLERLSFETDYGVDAGLLIDAAAQGARIAEVDVGHVEHDSHPLHALGDMARQVVRVLLDRAARYGRLNGPQLHEAGEGERLARTELSATLARIGSPAKLALFDMDGTLSRDRFIVRLARRTGRARRLAKYLDRPDIPDDERTRRIAALFAGVPRSEFEDATHGLRLTPGAQDVVVGLRQAGWRVGIVTDSFYVASGFVRRRVFADFSVAHVMRFKGGVATGEVRLAPAMLHESGCPKHVACKSNVLRHLAGKVSPADVMHVGDGINDVCLLQAVGTSVAFRPKSPVVAEAARHVVRDSLRDVLKIALSPSAEPDPV